MQWRTHKHYIAGSKKISDNFPVYKILIWIYLDWTNNCSGNWHQSLGFFFRLASDWLRHFRLLLWNRWSEFKETRQEARSQRPLQSFCFSGRSEKQYGRPGGLLVCSTFFCPSVCPSVTLQFYERLYVVFRDIDLKIGIWIHRNIIQIKFEFCYAWPTLTWFIVLCWNLVFLTFTVHSSVLLVVSYWIVLRIVLLYFDPIDLQNT